MRETLKRAIGPKLLLFFVIGDILGTGIYALTGSVAGKIGGIPERFESMDVRVRANYSDEDMMRKLIAIAERGCLVTNTLKDAVALSVHLEKTK